MNQIIDPAVREFAEFARLLAQRSGEVIRHYFRANYDIEVKSDESPVTVADRKAELLMRELIQSHYPHHGVMGEEFGHEQPNAAYQWVLDPIDGTKSFVNGTYLFGTLIALVLDSQPIIGVINNPVLNDFLIGTDGRCWLNDRQVNVSNCLRISGANLVTTCHLTPAEYQNGPAFDNLVRQVKQYRTWGDCHGYHLVATGGADIMTDPILNYWDLMALIPIIQGAGGTITDWSGGNVVESRGTLGAVATNGHIHDDVLRVLNPIA